MRMEFPEGPEPLAPEWWQPLERILAHIPPERPYSFFDPEDLMVMGRVVRPPRPTITLYKHVHTRRYLNLDRTGQAYRYAAPADLAKPARYLRLPDLEAGLRGLHLAELPWMKPSLAHERDVEDFWIDDEAAATADVARSIRGGAHRGHLRVV